MKFEIEYTNEAKKNIGKLSPPIKIQIKKAIERIAKNPNIGKYLTGILKNIQSYRTGDYRILYRQYRRGVLVLILTVGHRKNIYKKFKRKKK